LLVKQYPERFKPEDLTTEEKALVKKALEEVSK
jgi:hypothetical protein